MLVLDKNKGLKLISLPLTLKKKKKRDFPGGLVAKNLSASAGDTDRFSLCSGKTPYAMGQLSLCICNYWARRLQLRKPKL